MGAYPPTHDPLGAHIWISYSPQISAIGAAIAS